MVRRLLPPLLNRPLPNFSRMLAPLAFGYAFNLSHEGVCSKSGAVHRDIQVRKVLMYNNQVFYNVVYESHHGRQRLLGN
jgi:hypothetical protein